MGGDVSRLGGVLASGGGVQVSFLSDGRMESKMHHQIGASSVMRALFRSVVVNKESS